MSEMHEIDGLLILGITLVAVTVFSAFRGLYARSLATKRAQPEMVTIPIRAAGKQIMRPASDVASRRKAA